MIRAVGTNQRGGKLLVLGIDDDNVKRLTNGEPIICRGDTVGVSFDVVIVHGHTLRDVKATLEDSFTLPNVTFVGRGPTSDELDRSIEEARAEGATLWKARQDAAGTPAYAEVRKAYDDHTAITAVLIARREAIHG